MKKTFHDYLYTADQKQSEKLSTLVRFEVLAPSFMFLYKDNP